MVRLWVKVAVPELSELTLVSHQEGSHFQIPAPDRAFARLAEICGEAQSPALHLGVEV